MIHGRKDTGRRLKAHRKSRQGCRNCKLRKVKCDESKPMCNKCGIYGTFCNYDPRYSELQPLTRGASDVQSLQVPLCSENQAILGTANGATSHGIGGPNDRGNYFSVQDLELLHKFDQRTILTLGASSFMHIYRNGYAKLAYSHPFLLHIVLSVTLMHDKHLYPESNIQRSAALAHHWSQGAALLNRKLSIGIEPSERDALWACAGLLGALTFSSLSANSPEEAWPLKPSSPSDLDWLKMCEGKKEIWKIADPWRADSVFHEIVPDFSQNISRMPSPLSDLLKVSPELVQLCKLGDVSMHNDNPYLACLSFLARNIDVECNIHNIGIFLSFFGIMHPDFKQLLGCKDPCALLLLAYWYAKMCHCRQWWIWRRASLECQSICRYLTRYHSDNDIILTALEYPERVLLSLVGG